MRMCCSTRTNVHMHVGKFKGRRNLLYTACSRAMEQLKISGIKMDDGGHDMREKMELHPKSVLWQVRLGVGGFWCARTPSHHGPRSLSTRISPTL